MKLNFLLFTIIVLVNTMTLASVNVNSGWRLSCAENILPYTSMSLIEGLNKNIESIDPAVNEDNTVYLSSNSCLGSFGPVGAYGPLGLIGPIGSNTWNPEVWISTVLVAYSEWYDLNKNGPLSINGPLGYKGPLSEEAYYHGSLFLDNNFAVQLRSLGLWSILGPLGPLGALGSLGPLGLLGAYSENKNSSGEYLNKAGNVIRKCTMQYSTNNKRTYELYEKYTDTFAKGMTNNDTSFMVEGYLEKNIDESFEFKSSEAQLITILAVPLAQYEKLHLQITVNPKSASPVTIKSNSDNFINFIQLAVKPGTELKATVVPIDIEWNNSYRLFVTGGTQYLNKSNVTGKHIKYYKAID